MTQPYSGWGIRFLDYDNDGWKDLLIAQGHDLDNIDPEDRTLVGSALTEMLAAGYDLDQIQAVCRRLRKRVLAEDRSTDS